MNLSCYYLDEPLSPEEREFSEESLLGKNSRFATGATALVEKRIPNILPVPGKDGLFSSEPAAHVQLIKANLRRAGIRGDGGKQVLLVLPKKLSWGTIFKWQSMKKRATTLILYNAGITMKMRLKKGSRGSLMVME